MESFVCNWCNSPKENETGLCPNCHRFPPTKAIVSSPINNIMNENNLIVDMDKETVDSALSIIANSKKSMKDIIIIGASHAGVTTALELAAHKDVNGATVVIEDVDKFFEKKREMDVFKIEEKRDVQILKQADYQYFDDLPKSKKRKGGNNRKIKKRKKAKNGRSKKKK